jgi:hypothetical protein
MVYELQMQEQHTADSESSLLPTPTTQDNSGKCRDHGGDLLHEIICGCERSERKLLPTPTLGHIRNYDEDPQDYFDRVAKFESGEYNGKPGISLGVAVKLLPTPLVDDAKNTGHNQNRYPTLASEVYLLPTPVASEGYKAPAQQTSEQKSQTGQVWLSNAAKDMETTWGKYEPAIRQWEQVTNRPAPAPTKPDGKDAQHRLSAEFTEWLMGLPLGWITGIGLKRNDELKACGNGVVPQQAALALSLLDPQENHG